ncbi:nucleoside deaminase [Neorhodopirellula pilleata]|uniref:Guanine deaminase n=1 Tax=Neorhodopirellula pilleata TaxID=2714738 RepID=A0A5C6AQZ6_9BACT|nr:nucleoside deaminase [Neorhodopirellula pilleata]TWU01917.1 Guanine deaminase [Neorhodopirellula pilleata]
MDQVLDELRRGIMRQQSPFAAGVFSLQGDRLSLECNTVKSSSKPSRHGEINAIDQACRSIGKPNLSGYVLVSSAEPCPMCTATAANANVDAIVFGASRQTVAEAGYQTLQLGCVEMIRLTGQSISVIGGVQSDRCAQALLDNPHP